MADDLKEKAASWIIRSILAGVFGGGGWKLADGPWFGKGIFQSFPHPAGVTISGSEFIPDSLYRHWSLDSLLQSSEPIALRIAAVLPLTLLLVAHVLLRGHIRRAQQRLGTYRQPVRFYLGRYFLITALIYVTLLVLFLSASGPLLLLALFVGAVISGVVYVVDYYQDVRAGYGEQLTYWFVALFVVVFLFAWPFDYGRKAFDIHLKPVVEAPSDSTERCKKAGRLLGDAFVVDPAVDPTTRVLCTVCLDRSGGKVVFAQFHTINDKSLEGDSTAVQLRHWADPARMAKLENSAIIVEDSGRLGPFRLGESIQSYVGRGWVTASFREGRYRSRRGVIEVETDDKGRIVRLTSKDMGMLTQRFIRVGRSTLQQVRGRYGAPIRSSDSTHFYRQICFHTGSDSTVGAISVFDGDWLSAEDRDAESWPKFEP